MQSSKLSYRAEVDGLRAIAVLGVILYHANMIVFDDVLFSGGFIGVDVFFVISGYLITRIILSDLFEKGEFRFLDFYKKRIRRIVPMLLFVTFATMPFAWEKLYPSEFVEYAKSVIASLFFLSNFFFYFSATEYGAGSALLKPILHTWSLGVEEQFYLFFPIVTVLSFKFFKHKIPLFFVVLLIFSLGFSEWMTGINRDLSFYLPISRFWEFSIGSILAYFELRKQAKESEQIFLHKLLPAAGLGMILCSMISFGSNTHHPGLITIVPVVGTALILKFASNKEIVGKILGCRVFVWLGLVSYSAYLWHFPIFSFKRLDLVELDNEDKIKLILLVFLISVLSYFLVERPFRRKMQWKFVFSISSFSAFLILLGALYIIKTQGASYRYDYQENFSHFLNLDLYSYGLDHLEYAKEIQSKSEFSDGALNVLLVGNSHARDLLSALYQNAEEFEGMVFRRGDITQMSCFSPAYKEGSKERLSIEKFYSTEDYRAANVIVISTRFRRNRTCLYMEGEREDDYEGVRVLTEKALADGKRVIVFGSNPEFETYSEKDLLLFDYELTKLANSVGGAKNIDFDSFNKLAVQMPRLTYIEANRGVEKRNADLEVLVNELGVPYISKFQLVCSDTDMECEVMTPSGERIFWDKSHYTIDGAAYFGKKLAEKGFSDILRGQSNVLRNR